MEDPNCCMNEACLKKRKEKDDEIKKLQIEEAAIVSKKAKRKRKDMFKS